MDFTERKISRKIENQKEVSPFNLPKSILVLPLFETVLHYFDLKYMNLLLNRGNVIQTNVSGLFMDIERRRFKKVIYKYSRSLFPRISIQYLNIFTFWAFYPEFKKALTANIDNTGIFRKLFSFLFPSLLSSFVSSIAELKFFSWNGISILSERKIQFIFANSMRNSLSITNNLLWNIELRQRARKKFQNINEQLIQCVVLGLSSLTTASIVNAFDFLRLNSIIKLSFNDIIASYPSIFIRVLVINILLHASNHEILFLIY